MSAFDYRPKLGWYLENGFIVKSRTFFVMLHRPRVDCVWIYYLEGSWLDALACLPAEVDWIGWKRAGRDGDRWTPTERLLFVLKSRETG